MYTDSYFLVGGDISRSYSPEIYDYLFKKYDLNRVYSAFSVNPDKFKEIFSSLLDIPEISGFNVTYPFKEKASLFSKKTDEVRIIGGANTLVRKDSEFISYNTDGRGFVNFITRNSISTSGFIIAGTGTTARSIGYCLKTQLNILPVYISRNPERFRKDPFFEEYSCDVVSYEEVYRYKDSFLINATPVNLIDHELKSVFTCDKIFDVNYNFKNNLKYDGIILLIEQALINFELFTGIDVYDDYYCVNKYLTGVRKW